jgi:hypothetical protein
MVYGFHIILRIFEWLGSTIECENLHVLVKGWTQSRHRFQNRRLTAN